MTTIILDTRVVAARRMASSGPWPDDTVRGRRYRRPPGPSEAVIGDRGHRALRQGGRDPDHEPEADAAPPTPAEIYGDMAAVLLVTAALIGVIQVALALAGV